MTDLPRELHETLRPLIRALNAQRTLSVGKLGILRALADGQRGTSSELAARIRVSPQAISLATKEMEELGLVARTRDGDDRRKVWLVLTEAGQARLEQELRAGEQWLATAIEQRLTPDDVRALTAALPALARLAGDADA